MLFFQLLYLGVAVISTSTGKTATTCEWVTGGNGQLNMNCPAGTYIRVSSALYGRQDLSTCIPSGVDTSGFDLSCSSATAFSKVKQLCDEKTSCTVAASNGNFGDPCYGTWKYLTATYYCSNDWSAGVELNEDGSQVVTNIGEIAFNSYFARCPVVQYVRNGGVYAIYVRISPIPPAFNAFTLFTDTWASDHNQINVDFKLYDSLEDAKADVGAWAFCNYDDPDVGFPRDCGKAGAVGGKWFSMPGGRVGSVRGVGSGAGFHIFTGSMCPAPPGSGFPTVSIGRPFIVDGISRTTNSGICTDTDSDEGDENDFDSWRVGGAPSVPPSGKHNQEIGLYWLKQAEGEHASVASFARHTLQLMSKGAPARLLEAALNAALDEIKHAKMCYGIASAFLGKRIGPGSLDVVGSLENMELKEIVESLIVEGCFGETLSAIEARLAAHYAQDDAVKEVLKEIATDETRHGQLAWDTVGWIVKKQPDIQNYVNDVFEAQLKKLVVPSKNDTSLYGTPLCEDSEKETTLHGYGLLNKDDREKVRDVGIRDIIEPVYRTGFKHVNSISKGIMELNMNDL